MKRKFWHRPNETEILASLWSSKVIWENVREYSQNSLIETFVVYPHKEVKIWSIFIELSKLTSLLLIVSHNMIVKRKIGIKWIAWSSKLEISIARALFVSLFLNIILPYSKPQLTSLFLELIEILTSAPCEKLLWFGIYNSRSCKAEPAPKALGHDDW